MKEYPSELLDFFEEHKHANIPDLALKGFKTFGFSKAEILNQLTGLQIAKRKFPFLLSFPQFKFPPRISLEQASSESTAWYKSQLIGGGILADLSGGMGIDSHFLGAGFKEVHYVEKNEMLANSTARNFKVLGDEHIFVHADTASNFLSLTDKIFDWIFLDPSRRTERGRITALKNYQPDLIYLWDNFFEGAQKPKSKNILIKFSPIQDISDINNTLKGLHSIYVVEKDNEVKELLAIFKYKYTGPIELKIVGLKKQSAIEYWKGSLEDRNSKTALGELRKYLYEPSASILKAGIQDALANKHALRKLHANSNIYTSDDLCSDYPGKQFEVLDHCNYDLKKIAAMLASKDAHVISRNFPVGAEELKKKLSLKEKGSNYLVATTLANESKRMISCKRMN